MPLQYQNTPIAEIATPETLQAGIKLLVKREDLNHPFISGNKWWKLKYNLDAAQRQGYRTLLTFGGAYSNHIYATAAAAHELGLKSIGVIRGEETHPLNATLTFAKSKGMQLCYVSREAYGGKEDPSFIHSLRKRFGDFYLIPEGGTNRLAVQGVKEFAQQLKQEVYFDYVCLPIGTGGTMAGLIAGVNKYQEVVGISVLKDGTFLADEVKTHTKNFSDSIPANWRIETMYHHGGYAKVTPELFQFITEMNTKYSLPLDQVYTGKLMWGVLDMIRKDKFKQGSTVLVIHTGGLQGVQGS